MAESYIDKVANELADMALADQAASGDIAIVDQIGEVLGASSQILQETYNTAVRVRRAEARAREILNQRQSKGFKLKPKPSALLPDMAEDDLEDAEIIDPVAQEPAALEAPEAQEETVSAAQTFEEAKARARAESEAEAAAQAKAAEEAKRAKEAAAEAEAPKAKGVPAPWDLDGLDINDKADDKPAAPRRVTR